MGAAMKGFNDFILDCELRIFLFPTLSFFG